MARTRLKTRVRQMMSRRHKTSLFLETQRFTEAIRHRLLPMAKKANSDSLMAVALKWLELIFKGWPVDTGRSRAAWAALYAKHGIPFIPKGNSPAAIADGQAQGASEEQLRGVKQYIKMINGVVYSPFLEAGFSGQAPAGVLRVTMRQMRREIDREYKRRFGKVK